MKIFTGVAYQWYKQRVLYMYRTKPACGLVDEVNHLACLCPECKDTQFKRSLKFASFVFPYDRLYVFLKSVKNPLQKLKTLQKHFTDIRTSVEFPIPILRYQKLVHIPEFIDLTPKTVIDFLPADKIVTKRLIRSAETTLYQHGYRYTVFSDEGDLIYCTKTYTTEQLTDMHSALDRLLGATCR